MVEYLNLKKIKLKTGEVLINQGEHSTDFYFLISGSLAIFIGTRRVATIDKPGSLIGEMSFFMGEKRTATVIALTPVEVEVIPKDNVVDHFSENPDFAVTVAGSLAQRLSDTSKKLAEYHESQDYLDKLKRHIKQFPEFEKVVEQFDEVQRNREQVMKDFLNEKSIMSQKVLEPVIYGAIFAVKNLVGILPEKEEPFFLKDKEINMEAGSIVNITGDCEGWYSLAFPKETALKLAHKMTGREYTEIDDDIMSFIKELNNIMTGQIVTRINEYELKISVPTTLIGEDVLKKMIGSHPSVVVPFNTEVGVFYTILNIEIIK
jgi:CRP-like cAMP-binding protein/CheY-specific phosphatase CheX